MIVPLEGINWKYDKIVNNKQIKETNYRKKIGIIHTTHANKNPIIYIWNKINRYQM